MHGLTQFQPVGLLSTLDEQVRRFLDHDGTQKVSLLLTGHVAFVKDGVQPRIVENP